MPLALPFKLRIITTIRNSGTYYFSTVEPWDWTAPQNDGLWQDGAKTLFDPCPDGWRVPKSGEGTESPWNALTAENGLWNTSTLVNGGWLFNNSVIYNGQAWYPAAGFRDAGGNGILGKLGSVSYDGYSWSSTVSGIHAVNLGFNSGVLTPSYAYSRGRGLSVRCLRE